MFYYPSTRAATPNYYIDTTLNNNTYTPFASNFNCYNYNNSYINYNQTPIYPYSENTASLNVAKRSLAIKIDEDELNNEEYPHRSKSIRRRVSHSKTAETKTEIPNHRHATQPTLSSILKLSKKKPIQKEDKSTSTDDLMTVATSEPSSKKKKKKKNNDKSTQTSVKLILLRKEKRPPLPPTICKRADSACSFLTATTMTTPYARRSIGPLALNGRPVSAYSDMTSNASTKLRFLGVRRCDPTQYRTRYSSSLVPSAQIPLYLNKIMSLNHQPNQQQQLRVEEEQEQDDFDKTLFKFDSSGKVYKASL